MSFVFKTIIIKGAEIYDSDKSHLLSINLSIFGEVMIFQWLINSFQSLQRTVIVFDNPSKSSHSLLIIIDGLLIMIIVFRQSYHHSTEYLFWSQKGTFLALWSIFRYFYSTECLRGQGKYLPLIRQSSTIFQSIVFIIIQRTNCKDGHHCLSIVFDGYWLSFNNQSLSWVIIDCLHSLLIILW